MKTTNILYWIFTGLLAALMLFSGIGGLMGGPQAEAGFHNHLGYPMYLLAFISVAKILGVVAILVPGFPRIREWAYAGLTFDLLGAMYSIISVGDPFSAWAPLVIGLLLLAASYTLYHKRLRAA
ncbi:MAG TPA: DoxX family protein [Puia sp.]|jgi:uncharacterized membrane protein YphA (DoxX/SURF4 family)